MQHAFRFATHEQRRQSPPITGSHDDEIAMVLIGGIDDCVIGMVAGCHYGFAGHPGHRSGFLHKIKKVRGPDIFVALYFIQDNLVRVCVFRKCQRLDVIRQDMYAGNLRATKSGQFYTALYGSFRMFRTVQREPNRV